MENDTGVKDENQKHDQEYKSILSNFPYIFIKELMKTTAIGIYGGAKGGWI